MRQKRRRNHSEPQGSGTESRIAHLSFYHLPFCPGQRPEITPHTTLRAEGREEIKAQGGEGRLVFSRGSSGGRSSTLPPDRCRRPSGVAQIRNLLCGRIVFGSASPGGDGNRTSRGPRIANPRYSRVQLCATVAVPRCAPTGHPNPKGRAWKQRVEAGDAGPGHQAQ